MSPKRFAGFRIDEELFQGLEALKERDGIPQAEAVRRAIREYLERRGIQVVKADRKRVAARKRP